MNSHHNLRPADPLAVERWAEEAERQEREFAAARRKRNEQKGLAEVAAVDFGAEFAALRAELDQRREADLTAIGEHLADRLTQLIDDIERVNKAARDLLDRRFAALEERLVNLEPRGKDFKFAREREEDGAAMLPQFLPRRAIN
jgi:hypothetical protein